MTDRPASPARLAARMRAIEPFHAMDVLARAHALEAAGRSIVHMEVGEPDFETPRPVLERAARVTAKGSVPYTQALGLPALREAIARFYAERYHVEVAPERIVVTAGASGALLLAMGVLVNPGEEVLMADPCYPCNRQFIRVMGGEPRCLPVGPETRWQPTAELLGRHWGERTAAALVASPANPTGTMIDHAELGRIAALVEARGGVLVVDEIYHGLTYGLDARTALALSDRVFVVNSFSKYFDMTGWRLGWLVAPPEYVRELEKLQQNLFICPSTVAQQAALAAFEPATIDLLEGRRREFQARRDFLLPALRELGFGLPVVPEGAFYLYADCARFSSDSFAFALEILERAGVALTPGRDFGQHLPERHLRIAYTTSRPNLELAVERLRSFLASR
ncbi:pyridoxal phosphate-dependent aminotransferase [Anaeromyxobacter paludicola]|uniref:Aminotransferase n=1 Tax=Anaeromyxobacter paludicola TaxID=2918171 RepID=A0ABN6N9C8_9BACT|nr:pyridoxal phosphate-dependent aminotransferase [Anaeromyxobacter paludicola]BDG09837.1 aminotransferase [Anaeromyxobacter paludicola]